MKKSTNEPLKGSRAVKVISPWEAANHVMDKLRASGFQAYACGGAVRDKIMNLDIRDVDVATNALPEEVLRLFPASIDVGVEHGTVVVPVKGDAVEVTAFRGKTIEEDLSMRDFTINAMAMTREGEIIDPFNGRDDIENGIIRGVRDPEARFKEDPLRMVRGYRFAFAYGFTIESNTAHAIGLHASLVKKSAVERIGQELEKMLPLSKGSLIALMESPIAGGLAPLLYSRQKWLRLLSCYNHPFTVDEVPLCWYILSDDNLTETLNRYRRSNLLKKQAGIIERVTSEIVTAGWSNQTLYQAGEEWIYSCEKIRALLLNKEPEFSTVKKKFEQLPIKKKSDMAVNGKMLMEEFQVSEGKWIGNTLKKVEYAIVTKKTENTKTAVFEYIRKELTG
ncbi:CCA tRNA nucleotidyltransferase [Alteribacter keqinensis]|uniref:CCA tRNA nucleotidyltransferase n=1 Tax=Alteribacter keqinensis TaxID=2483800 RepID=A0A3M7TVA7_9BACI|nr:CCA tRNA nucleotidyltransferase [Alteribacter keqinensis]